MSKDLQKVKPQIDVKQDKIVSPPMPIQQPALFPMLIVETYANNSGSADLNLIGRGRDGKHYAIKTIHENNGFIPASEFFCYRLARLVAIPTPAFEHLELQCGGIAFGSVWEGGATTVTQMNEMLAILKNDIVENLDFFIGKVYGFDLFVNNEDRHFGNYIFRDSFNNKRIGLAFDFSRAWKEVDPFGYNCIQPGCNTMKYNGYSRRFGRYNKQAALDVLDEISSISKCDIESILDGMDSSWMADSEKKLVLDWWSSTEFYDRITKLKGVV